MDSTFRHTYALTEKREGDRARSAFREKNSDSSHSNINEERKRKEVQKT